MQISSENYITVLTEQIKNLTIENAQLKAHILDLEAHLEAQAKGGSDGKTEGSGSEATE